MFSPNLSNRAKAFFVVGVVVVVSCFWLLSSRNPPSQDKGGALEPGVRSVNEHDTVGHNIKLSGMASKTVELRKDMELLSPPVPQEVVKKTGAVDSTEGTVDVDGVEVFYREAKSTGEPKLQVLLLHGQAFSSQNWLELGTLGYLAAMGHRAVAIDIPGYGKSRSGRLGDPVTFMTKLISSLDLSVPVIVSPSMSGSVSLPFLIAHPEKVKGYIPVAPVYTGKYASHYSAIKVPTVIVYGDKDTTLGPESLKNLSLLPNHCVVKLAEARHPAYLDQPKLWHNLLYNFLSKF